MMKIKFNNLHVRKVTGLVLDN